MDWFQIGKGAHQGYILLPCLFNFCAEYIMGNARLDEAQVVIKISERNINNLTYVEDTTLMTRGEEELKSLLRVKKESEEAGLKLNIKKQNKTKTKMIGSGSIASWQIQGGKWKQ